MGRDPPTHAVELTLQAERLIDKVPAHAQLFLRKAIDFLAVDSEPDGLTKTVAPAVMKYPGCLMLEVYPFRIVYQLVGPNRLIVVAIVIHPNVPMM